MGTCMISGVWRRIDDVLRFGYVLLCPMMIAALTGLIPVSGILINASVATAIAILGFERWSERTLRIPVIGKPLAGLGRLGEYYASHPPKPLLYYVLYPLFAPYWLFVRSARTELFAYKRLGVFAVVITAVTSAVEYAQMWRPLPFKYFATAMFATSVMQLLFTFMFVMPLVTTVVTFHRVGHRKSLIVLGVIGLLLGLLMALAMRKADVVPFATEERIYARIRWKPDDAHAVMERALDRAVSSANPEAALAAARTELTSVFRADEARAFHLLAAKDMVVLWARVRSARYAWRARTAAGPVMTAAQLSPEARALLRVEPHATPWP